jgi:hydroxymethylpyrimidine/phosphomethylpyrimidine kinase
VLVFAASDPSSGAGIQADILTLASLGCHPLTVITALTVQDTVGVESLHPVDAELVEQQARALLEDMPVAAFKLGVLGSVENVLVVAEIVADYPEIPLVFDPVLASGRGDEFSGEDMLTAMREMLLPQTTVLTPNSLEARRLLQAEGESVLEEVDEDGETLPPPAVEPGESEADDAPEPALADCASQLLEAGCQYVLITGTHENTPQVCNTLYGPDGVLQRDVWDRLPGSYHGSGCTLASAIAGRLAAGAGIEDAVREAQEYTWRTLAAGFRPGMGQFIPDRLFWGRPEEDDAETATDASDGEPAVDTPAATETR